MGVYLRLIESTLTTADKRAYRTATRELENARRAARAADLSEEFDDYVTALRAHRRRPTLIAMLDKAGLRESRRPAPNTRLETEAREIASVSCRDGVSIDLTTLSPVEEAVGDDAAWVGCGVGHRRKRWLTRRSWVP